MIDPHVHLRDWNQRHKETVEHGFAAASLAGVTGMFEMPNTDPALTDAHTIERRLSYAQDIQKRYPLVRQYGLYAGLTAHRQQIEQMVQVYEKHHPAVIGFKLFAGHSTGDMGIVDKDLQQHVYTALTELGYRGILAVHCEKESLMDPEAFDPGIPATHSIARPPEAETASVTDQLDSALNAGFQGILHIAHVSCPETIEIIEQFREVKQPAFIVTTGVTPHHALLDGDRGYLAGMFAKMNPPLRDRERVDRLFTMLTEGRADWIETDHAPHTAQEKASGASGIPGFAGYGHLVLALMDAGIDHRLLQSLTGGRFSEVAGLPVYEQPLPDSKTLLSGLKQASSMYEWDLFEILQF
jgi:dihydroorotase